MAILNGKTKFQYLLFSLYHIVKKIKRNKKWKIDSSCGVILSLLSFLKNEEVVYEITMLCVSASLSI
jgi:hypothetical protein